MNFATTGTMNIVSYIKAFFPYILLNWDNEYSSLYQGLCYKEVHQI